MDFASKVEAYLWLTFPTSCIKVFPGRKRSDLGPVPAIRGKTGESIKGDNSWLEHSCVNSQKAGDALNYVNMIGTMLYCLLIVVILATTCDFIIYQFCVVLFFKNI